MTVKIVLVEPIFAGNIGSIARVMKNFGFHELILINPKTELTEETFRFAMHAQEIVEKAKIFSSLEDFLPTVSYTVGTTANISSDRGSTNSRIAVSSDDPRLENILQLDGDVAILFGREDSGLSNQEIDNCDMTIHIPTSKDYLTLNLAQAVAIILYSLSIRNKPGIKAQYREANSMEKEKLMDWFAKTVSVLEFDARKEELLVRRFRNIIGRAFVSGKEATSLLAVFSRSYNLIMEYQKSIEQEKND